jgi:four helix bundle suffix protein
MSFPKYKYLLTYRYSEIIHDFTNDFLKKFLFGIEHTRTRDQMFQAARSGKQNIVEGISAGKTSKKTEIKLLNVAAASLDELLTDYEDYLRQRNLSIWPKTDEKVKRMQHYCYRISHLSNLSDLGNLIEKPKLPQNPIVAANLLLTLCHLATFLLSKQIRQAEADFLEYGGFTENLFKRRIQARIKV